MATIACSKNYSITVASSFPEPFAYFKCGDDPASTLVDQIAARNLVAAGGSPTSVAGKIGTAVRLGGGLNTTWVNGPSADWVFNDDFTLRFWIKPAHASFNKLILSNTQFDLWLMADFWVFGQMTLEWLVDTNPGDATVDSVIPLTLGAWNHVVCWFENGVGVGVVINNGAAELAAGANPIQSYATRSLLMTDSNFMAANAIDEIAIWKQKLTPAQIATDYNGGAGQTYPWT